MQNLCLSDGCDYIQMLFISLTEVKMDQIMEKWQSFVGKIRGNCSVCEVVILSLTGGLHAGLKCKTDFEVNTEKVELFLAIHRRPRASERPESN